ncbi:MAG: hypothetical protein A3F72_10460 [Bacteroidetes bacterium RIFCSPLOWO2_12_FULL_35_15]|nr:MAG: hypothetical protein A3F72_10460 [Bacteroidetes bacterium RIFCSPLOWO2_12_FULL_35_15]
MKKNILSLTAIALIASAAIFTGCKKDDTTAPVVTPNGASQTIFLQGSYTELGATAEDDKDGVLTTVTGGDVVNVNLTGVYVITYTATDAAGNEGTASITVTVRNAADALEGTYTASEVDILGPYSYNPAKPFTVTASTTVNFRVNTNRLGDYDNNAVYMMVTGTTISIPSQTIANVGSGTATCDVHSRQTDGSGTITSNGFTLTYNDAKVAPCTGTRTGVVATFVKQ